MEVKRKHWEIASVIVGFVKISEETEERYVWELSMVQQIINYSSTSEIQANKACPHCADSDSRCD